MPFFVSNPLTPNSHNDHERTMIARRCRDRFKASIFRRNGIAARRLMSLRAGS
jgi:hypothetical protein